MRERIRKLRPLRLPGLGLHLVDMRTLDEEDAVQLQNEFVETFGGGFLKRNFPNERLCTDITHLRPVYEGYQEYIDVQRKADEPIAQFEEWSETNGRAFLDADFHTAPHENVLWFAFEDIDTGERVGAIQISRINTVKRRPLLNTVFLSGHAIMTLPRRQGVTYAQLWGRVINALLDKEFKSVALDAQIVVFEEWIFPTKPRGRYVNRPGLPFGGDIIDEAAGGALLEREDESKEFAPRNLRKSAREAAAQLGE